MHIAITLEHFAARAGGAEGFAVTILQELLARGHRLSVLALDGEPLAGVSTCFAPLAEAPARLAALAPDLTVDWGLNLPADLHRLGGGTHREFLRLVLESKPLPVRLAKSCWYALSRRHRALARRETALLSRPGVHVLAVSRFVANQVSRTVALPAARLHVLHNGVDTRRFVPGDLAQGRADERARLGLQEGEVAFLLVGHNLGLKNFALLRDLFAAHHCRFPAARLLLLGRRDPGVRAPWFVYAGSSARPETVYAAADVLLHPTFYDACANVVLEALAAGLPVVSSDRNGSAELLTHGREGFVLPVVGARDRIRAQWSAAVGDLTTQPERRRQMGTAARSLAETLTIKAYADRFEALLQRLHEERGHPEAGGQGMAQPNPPP